LTDALNDRQRWFDAMTAQHNRDVHYWQDQALNARVDEREACAGLCDRFANRMMSAEECADAIRARSNT
jgi:hypothetical protein